MKAKLLQLTNMNIGAIVTDSFMPLGIRTVTFPGYDGSACSTYSVTSSTSDTLVINKPGTYRILYSASVVATEAGDVTFEVIFNGTSKYSVTATATAAGTVNLTIPYEIYVPCNCCSNPNNVPAYV